MHIPTVTDEMLDKVLEAAMSPVAVLFTGMDADPDRCALVRRRLRLVAEDWDDRVIFLFIDGDENPTPAARWNIREAPALLVFIRGDEVGRCLEGASRETIEELLRMSLARKR